MRSETALNMGLPLLYSTTRSHLRETTENTRGIFSDNTKHVLKQPIDFFHKNKLFNLLF
jgi:hypothetical protein